MIKKPCRYESKNNVASHERKGSALYIAGSLLRVLCACFILGVIWSFAINSIVCNLTSSRIHKEPPSGGKYDCILVLGAGLLDDGSPSAMLYDRVICAVNAYFSVDADTIIMSGDKKLDRDYDEPATMAALALERGVDESALIRDEFGYSTYLSILNARDKYGAERILIVTQGYHVSRAVYIADLLGLEAEGVACDARIYRSRLFHSAREFAARVKDFAIPLFVS